MDSANYFAKLNTQPRTDFSAATFNSASALFLEQVTCKQLPEYHITFPTVFIIG